MTNYLQVCFPEGQPILRGHSKYNSTKIIFASNKSNVIFSGSGSYLIVKNLPKLYDFQFIKLIAIYLLSEKYFMESAVEHLY